MVGSCYLWQKSQPTKLEIFRRLNGNYDEATGRYCASIHISFLYRWREMSWQIIRDMICLEIQWFPWNSHWSYERLHQDRKWGSCTKVDQRSGCRPRQFAGIITLIFQKFCSFVVLNWKTTIYSGSQRFSFLPVSIPLPTHWRPLTIYWPVTRKFKRRSTTSSWIKLINMYYHSTCTSFLLLPYWRLYLELKCREMCATNWFRTYHTSTSLWTKFSECIRQWLSND